MSTRDIYVEKLKSQLDQWNGQLEQLEQSVQEMEGEAQARYQSEIDAMRTKMKNLLAKLGAVETAEQGNWEGLKADIETTRDAFTHAFNYFKSQLPAAQPTA